MNLDEESNRISYEIFICSSTFKGLILIEKINKRVYRILSTLTLLSLLIHICSLYFHH